MTGARITPPDPDLSDGDVLLRPWRDTDAEAIWEACQDPEIPRWTRVPAPYREEDARSFIAASKERWREGTSAAFAIVDARTDELLGSIGLVSPKASRGEIGYWVKREARRRGTATRALKLIAEWAFKELGFARLQLVTDPLNERSQRVAERAGFQREGVLRSFLEIKGRRKDCVIFSLLPEDPGWEPREELR